MIYADELTVWTLVLSKCFIYSELEKHHFFHLGSQDCAIVTIVTAKSSEAVTLFIIQVHQRFCSCEIMIWLQWKKLILRLIWAFNNKVLQRFNASFNQMLSPIPRIYYVITNTHTHTQKDASFHSCDQTGFSIAIVPSVKPAGDGDSLVCIWKMMEGGMTVWVSAQAASAQKNSAHPPKHLPSRTRLHRMGRKSCLPSSRSLHRCFPAFTSITLHILPHFPKICHLHLFIYFLLFLYSPRSQLCESPSFTPFFLYIRRASPSLYSENKYLKRRCIQSCPYKCKLTSTVSNVCKNNFSSLASRDECKATRLNSRILR